MTAPITDLKKYGKNARTGLPTCWETLGLDGRRIHRRATHYRIVSLDKQFSLANGYD